jgi:hypothetical protein
MTAFIKALPFKGHLIPDTLADELCLQTQESSQGPILEGLARHGNFTITNSDSIFVWKLHYLTCNLEMRSQSLMLILEALNLGKTPEEVRLQILDIWSKPPSVSAPDISGETTFHSIVNLSSVTNPYGFSRNATTWDAVTGKVCEFTFVIKPGDFPSMVTLTLWDTKKAKKVTGQVHPNNLAKVLSLITPNLSGNDFLDLCDSVV